jgi:hypothetical protein
MAADARRRVFYRPYLGKVGIYVGAAPDLEKTTCAANV